MADVPGNGIASGPKNKSASLPDQIETGIFGHDDDRDGRRPSVGAVTSILNPLVNAFKIVGKLSFEPCYIHIPILDRSGDPSPNDFSRTR